MASETILIVEDDETLRKLTARVLRASGYVVSTARGAKEALEGLEGQAERPTLMLLDLLLPGISGPELARLVADQCGPIKVLFMSGYSIDGAAGLLEPGAAFLGKPFTPRQLNDAVRELLEKTTGVAPAT